MVLFEEIYHKAFHMLDTQLPSFLTYHSPRHTEYVIEQAEFIGINEKVSQSDLFLIKVGALLHDIGFIRQYKNHEEAGCDIAIEFLKEFSMSPEYIALVCGMIMATKIPQTPKTLNEMILADADLEYLGTSHFHPVSEMLYQEMHYMDPDLDRTGYQRIQIDFLSKHSYHTSFCRQHREIQKQIHLRQLQDDLVKSS